MEGGVAPPWPSCLPVLADGVVEAALAAHVMRRRRFRRCSYPLRRSSSRLFIPRRGRHSTHEVSPQPLRGQSPPACNRRLGRRPPYSGIARRTQVGHGGAPHGASARATLALTLAVAPNWCSTQHAGVNVARVVGTEVGDVGVGWPSKPLRAHRRRTRTRTSAVVGAHGRAESPQACLRTPARSPRRSGRREAHS